MEPSYKVALKKIQRLHLYLVVSKKRLSAVRNEIASCVPIAGFLGSIGKNDSAVTGEIAYFDHD